MKIKVYEDRFLVAENIVGSQYENLATTLEFEFPETINNIPISEFNKYIVFDIEAPENQSLIINDKYSIPYEITKLGNVTFYVKLMQASEDENITDKVIWISRGLEILFNKTEEGKAIIVTPEKLDAFNVAVTELNETTSEAKELINTVETKLENGEFNGKDGENGLDGKDGINGTNGKDGANGLTPYIKDSHWYIGETNTNVRAEGKDGANGTNGKDGVNGKDGKDGEDYILTDADKKEIAGMIELTTEEWTFTLEDGSTVTKKVVLG